MLATRSRQGVLLAVLSSLLGGTAVATTRLALVGLDHPVEPLLVVAIRYAIGALCLLPWAAAAARRVWSAGDAGRVLLLSLMFYTLFPYLLTLSLTFTTAARGALALSTMPLLTLVAALVARVERFRALRLLGVAIALGGVAVALGPSLAGAGVDAAWRGDLIMVGAAVLGALYNVASRPFLRRYPALPLTALGLVVGAVTLGGIALATAHPLGLQAAPPSFWPVMLYLGIGGCALPFFLWTAGLERTAPTNVAVTVTLNPVSAMILGLALLGEPVTPALVGGLVAVVAGIVLANRPAADTPARPSP